MQNKMNMENKTYKCVPRNSQINLSAQDARIIGLNRCLEIIEDMYLKAYLARCGFDKNYYKEHNNRFFYIESEDKKAKSYYHGGHLLFTINRKVTEDSISVYVTNDHSEETRMVIRGEKL